MSILSKLGPFLGMAISKIVFLVGIILTIVSGVNLPLIIFDWTLKVINIFSGATFVNQLILGDGEKILHQPFFYIYIIVIIISFIMMLFITVKNSIRNEYIGLEIEQKNFRSNVEKYKWILYWFIGIFAFPFMTLLLSWLASILTGLFSNTFSITDTFLSDIQLSEFYNKFNSYINYTFNIFDSKIIYNSPDILNQIFDGTISTDNLNLIIDSFNSQNIWKNIFIMLKDNNIDSDTFKEIYDKYSSIFGIDASNKNFNFISDSGILNLQSQMSSFLSFLKNKNEDIYKIILEFNNGSSYSLMNYLNGNVVFYQGEYIDCSLNYNLKPLVTFGDIQLDNIRKNNSSSFLMPEKITIVLNKILFPTMSSNIYGVINNSIIEILSPISFFNYLFNTLKTVFNPFKIIPLVISIISITAILSMFFNLALIVLQRNFEVVYLTTVLPFKTVQGLNDNGQKFEAILKTLLGKIAIVFIISFCLSIFSSLLELGINISNSIIRSYFSETAWNMWFSIFILFISSIVLTAMSVALLNMINLFSQTLDSNVNVEKNINNKQFNQKINSFSETAAKGFDYDKNGKLKWSPNNNSKRIK